MKTPFQPWCRSDGHQFYWGGSGCGVTGRCKWEGVGTGMGLERREMLNVSKVHRRNHEKSAVCSILCNTSVWHNGKYLYESGVGSWLLECGTHNLWTSFGACFGHVQKAGFEFTWLSIHVDPIHLPTIRREDMLHRLAELSQELSFQASPSMFRKGRTMSSEKVR